MLQIVIACTRNGQFVPTGIETDVVLSSRCRRRCLWLGARHAAAIIIGLKARPGFATLNLHRGRCCLPRLSAAT